MIFRLTIRCAARRRLPKTFRLKVAATVIAPTTQVETAKKIWMATPNVSRLQRAGFVLLLVTSTNAVWAAPPISLQLRWWRYADPGAHEHPDAPINPLTDRRDGLETDREEVGAESAVISPDSRLVVTTSRSNARSKGPGDPPRYVHQLNDNTSHLQLYRIDGTLLWDRARSRAPDKVDNRSGASVPDGIPDDVPLNDDGDPEDELEHAEFTRHASNAGRYVVAAGEDDKIEVWQILGEDGVVLEQPELVRTLEIPGDRTAAFDSLGFSHSGELLAGGTEYFGHIEFWRATGEPSTWRHVGHASHGGSRKGKAVNEFDFSPDDRYVITAGTDQKGGFWKMETTRDEITGQIHSVDLHRLATMPQPNRSSKAARIQNRSGRLAFIASKDQRTIVFLTDDLISHTDPATSPEPVMMLHNGLYHGVDRMTGVEIEPGASSRDGRFLVVGGGPEEHFEKHPNTADYRSSFFRIYESDQIRPGAPEPDPVWVQPAFHSEFFFFNEGDTLLATAHDDGTARLWDVAISGTRTIAAEGFNEPTETHQRWTLAGPRSRIDAAADPQWGVTHDRPRRADRGTPGWKQQPAVAQSANWVGHRGARFLAAGNLGGEVHRLRLHQPWSVSSFRELEVRFAAAGLVGHFEQDDFLRLSVDFDGDDVYETVLAEFRGDDSGSLARQQHGESLTPMFTDFSIPLDTLLPANFSGQLRFQVEARTDAEDEELAFDSLRVTGRPVN